MNKYVGKEPEEEIQDASLRQIMCAIDELAMTMRRKSTFARLNVLLSGTFYGELAAAP